MTDFTRPAGATPLDPDTLEGLLPDLTTKRLDDASGLAKLAGAFGEIAMEE